MPWTRRPSWRMYLRAMGRIGRRPGCEHYEISSFALPGRRCRHNEVYWANHAYFGFGLGAARYVEFRREVNTRDLQTYIRKALAGESPSCRAKLLDDEQRARETLALNLRRARGSCARRSGGKRGSRVDALAGAAIRQSIGKGVGRRHRGGAADAAGQVCGGCGRE